MKLTLRRGQQWRRKSDGYVFTVLCTSCTVPGAHLQCVDASQMFGFFYADVIARDFERIARRDHQPIAPWVHT